MLAFLLGAVIALGASQVAAAPSPSATTPAPPPPSASPPPTSAQTTPATPPPAPRLPEPAPISRATVIEPTGRTALAAGGESVVDAASSFEVELPGRVADARLVLLDLADAHVPAKATSEIGAVTRLVLVPGAPLAPGSRYVLRVEGAATRELHGGDRAWAPASFPLLVAGTPAPPEPRKKARPKRHRR